MINPTRLDIDRRVVVTTGRDAGKAGRIACIHADFIGVDFGDGEPAAAYQHDELVWFSGKDRT